MMRVLYYVHDPMCSWCWAFSPTWKRVKDNLPNDIAVTNLVGGLAPDSDQTMPIDLQHKIQSIWKHIQTAVPGTDFNFDFWSECEPRRSTYASCRAVIAAASMDAQLEDAMITGIQRAYYLKAMNPSNDDVLISVAQEVGLDPEQFANLLHSEQVEHEFHKQRSFCHQIGGVSFPSLFLAQGEHVVNIEVSYTDPQLILQQL